MSTESIRRQVRKILGDEGEVFTAQQTSDGITVNYNLPESDIDPDGFVASIVGVGTLQPGTDYRMDFRFGILTLKNPLPSGAILVASGITYREFLPEDLDEYIQTAFLQHTNRRSPPIVLDAPSPDPGTPPAQVLPRVEERLVAIRAVIEALWDMATDASQDIDIATPDGVSIARTERYNQIMGQIALQEERYRELAAQLNVGLFRVEMATLRRVSRTTNRLVPIYDPREVDDHTFPKRALPPIDHQADRIINYRGQYSSTVKYFKDDMVDEGGIAPTMRTTFTTAKVALSFSGGLQIPVQSTSGFYPVGMFAIDTIANGVQQLSYTGLSTDQTKFVNCSAGFGIAPVGARVQQAIGTSSARFVAVQDPPIGTDPVADVLSGDGANGHYWQISTLNSAFMGQW